MEEKDELLETNKNDNTKRLIMSAICVLLLLIIAFCVYLLFFYNKGDGNESSVPYESSFVPVIVTSNEPESSDTEISQVTSSEESSDEESSDVTASSSESYTEPSSEPSSNTSDTSGDESSEPEESSDVSSDTELDHQWYGYVYRYLNHAIEDFTPSAASKQAYIDALNSLYAAIGRNSSFYHMIIPTQVEFLRSSFPPEVTSSSGDGFYTQGQAAFINRVKNDATQGIKHIDVTSLFTEKYNAGEYLYFNTDKNYTALGAYYAYTEFCKAAGLTPVARDQLTEGTVDRFLGTFYTSTSSKTLEDNPDKVVFYDIDQKFPADVTIYSGTSIYNKQKMIFTNVSSVANGYNVFFGREAYRIEISVKQPASNKSILIIGDLSAAPFAPYLAANYKTITFINATMFNDKYYVPIKEFLNGKKYDDILVMDYSTSYKSPFLFSSNIKAMLED